MIPSEKVYEIIEKIDILEVVSRYVKLRKTGRNYKGLCPFHPERTPSFFVNSEKQIFHCFGCGTGGNVLSFLMKIENASFAEAVMLAAEMAGIQIQVSGYSDQADARKKIVFEANKIAMKFFKMSLESSQGNVAVDFLEKRGIGQLYREKFAIGYAPARNSLVDYINANNLAIGDFEQAGLVIKKETGYTDLFRHRVIIPIFDHRNNICGFGARAIEDQQQPKYLNTPENYVFKKGNLFYGLNWAKERIKSSGFAIIVEGYFDLIKMHMAGFENTIAPLGTALTENHMRLLKRWTDKILLVFDSDSAGTAAAFRSLETILAGGFEVKIGVMPSGFDPEDFLDNYGNEALKKLLNQSKDVVDFAFQIGSQKHSIDNPKGRAVLIEEILGLIKHIPDDIERSIRIGQLAKITGVSEGILAQQLKDIPEKETSQSFTQLSNQQVQSYAENYAEKTLIKILLRQPSWADEIKPYLNLLPETISKVVEHCTNNEISGKKISKILNQFNPEISGFLTQAIFGENDPENIDITRKEFYDCVKVLCKKAFENRRRKLQEIIKQKTESGQPCDKELEELQFCINQANVKNLESILSRQERSVDVKNGEKE
ncbi:MAG TPA: DNA primase [bacterium]|nr:DNA primase [bacterium]HOL35953.1 DNA primase [bacterium]HPP08738.1 DNA primase [bacterium]